VVGLTVEQVLASAEASDLVERFNAFAFAGGAPGELRWKDLPLLKAPTDLWSIVELIQELRPSAIVETGTHHGGSAVFYADIAATLGIPTVVCTVDVNPKWAVDPGAHGVESFVGLSTDVGVVARIKQQVDAATADGGHVLVLLDSDHSEENVARELELYAPLVTPGSFLVVEDTNTSGARVATDRFLAAHPEFVADRTRERFLWTWYPGGWLRRLDLDASEAASPS
jgi:cephalosporin hydroxylase